MRADDRCELERALRNLYRTGDGDAMVPGLLVEAIAAEMERPVRPRAVAVVAEQVRRIGVGAWALHVVLAAVAVLGVRLGLGVGTVAAVLGTMLALCALASVTRSRSCGMVELEAACPVNAQAAACARVLALCCVDGLAIVLFTVQAGSDALPAAVLAQGLAPYLVASGAGLLAARRAASVDATIAAVTAAAAVCGICILARTLWPAAFGSAAALVWWGVAAVAVVFASLEGRAWLRASVSGFTDMPGRAAVPMC